MENALFTLIFRLVAVVSGLLLLILSILIYRKTRSATKGWFYLSLFGVWLFLWSSTAMGLKGEAFFLPRMLTGIIFLLAIAYFVLYSYTRLAEDFWVQKPKWLTNKTSTAFMGLCLILIGGYNLLFLRQDFQTNLLPKLLSITLWTVGLAFLFSAIPTYYLFKASKEWRWGTAFLSCLLAGLAINFGVLYAGCCGTSGNLTSDQICADYDTDYMRVYDSSCNMFLVTLGKYYQLMLILSVIFVDTSFFLIWRSLGK